MPKQKKPNTKNSMWSKDNTEPIATGSLEDETPLEEIIEMDDAKASVAERRQNSPFRFNKAAFAMSGLALLVIGVVASGTIFFVGRTPQKPVGSQTTGAAANYKVGNLSVEDVQAAGQLKIGTADTLAINGQLQVSKTLVLAPTAAPAKPTVGQIYFDRDTKQPYYYNGDQFIGLAPNTVQTVTSVGGASGVIGLGAGLEVVNGQLGVSAAFSQQLGGSRVTSLQGQTGDVQLVAGSGIAISGTTITNQGVLGLTGGSGITVTPDGNGNYTVSSTGTGIGGSGTAGQIALFTGSQTLGSSVLSQSGAIVTVAGDLTVTGTLSANSLQQTGAGLDVTISAGNDDIVFTAGGRTFIFPTTGGSSQTICTTGISCASGGGQAVLLQPGSAQTDNASGESIFIDNTGGGTLIRLQGNGSDRFTVANNGNTTVAGVLTVQGSGGIVVGVPGSVAGRLSLASTANTNTGALQIATLGQGTTYILPDPGVASATICLSTNNCPASGVTSLNSLSGALILNNSSGSGSAITIDNASTSAKGIAQFNATNFTVSSGTVNTIQDIATTSTPTFGGLTLTSALTVANGGTGLNSVTANGILYGNGTSALQTTSAAANSILATNGSNTPSLTQTLPVAVQGNITNTGVLISGSIAAGFGSISTNSTITTTTTVQGATLNATSAIQLNGTNINTAGTLNNVAYLNQANNFSANNTFGAAGTGLAVTNNATIGGTLNGQTISSAANFTGTLSVQGAGGITVGVAGSTTGNLNLANSSSSRLVIIQGLNPSGSGNATVQIPTLAGGSTDTICLQTLNNCAASGAISGTGTTNYVARFTGTNTIGIGTLYDSGTAVSVGGTSPAALFNVGASNQFQVSNTGAVTAVGLNAGSGLIQGTGGLTTGGTITFSSLNTAGVVHTDGLGQLSTGVVVLGAETSGDYIATLGTLTGLSTTGNSGEGSTPTLSVLYGGTANTAVQGNTTLTCASGSGNLSGGGNSVTLGLGGSCNAITITNSPTFSGTLTVQGSGGVVIGVAGSTTGNLSLANAANSNLGSLQVAALGQATTYILPDPGAASVDICLSTGNCAGAGGGITGSGTSGRLSKFNGTGTITDSTLSESGTTLTASGNLVIQGNNSLTLGVASSADGSIAFKNNSGTHTVTLQAPQTDPAGDIAFYLPNADGSNGQCLKTDGTGNLTFAACTGGVGGGVTSLNSQTGVVNINNASGSGGAITIDNASTSAKGIAQFNAINFSASSGTINTIQDIATTSSPTFAGLTLSNALTVANGGTGAATFTSNGILYGNGAGTLQVTTAAANSILITNGSNVPSLGQTLPTAVQGNITTTGTLTSGAIGSGFGTIATSNNITTTATIQGGTLNGVSAIQLNGTDINTAGTLTNVAYLNQANIFTGNNIFRSSSNSTTAFQIQNSSSQALFVADTTNQRLAVGPAATPANGILTIGTNTTTAGGGLYFGTDTNLYREAANALRTDGLLQANSLRVDNGSTSFNVATNGATTLYVDSGLAFAVQDSTGTNNLLMADTVAGQVGIGSVPSTSLLTIGTNTTTATGGVTFGTDTNLYRNGSDSLRTDDSLQIGGSAEVQGGLTIGIQGSVTGNLNLANASSSRMVVLQGLDPTGTGNATIQFPSVAGGSTDTVCLQTLANCAGAGGVSSLNGQTGAVTLNNASGSGGAITIDDASTSTKGIAQFNSTNFSASSGTINTIQDIATTSSPTFNGLTANGTFTANGTALFKKSVDSSTAFQVQNAAARNLIQGDTSTMTVNIGNNTDGGYVNIGNTSQGIYLYNNGGSSNEIGTGSGRLSFVSDGFDFVPGADGTSIFRIQNAAQSTTLLTADTTNNVIKVGTTASATQAGTALFVTAAEFSGALRVGDGTNRVQVDGTTKKISYVGSARQDIRVTLTPEYQGAVLTADGSNNVGTMTSDFCSGSSRLNINSSICGSTDEFNYYSWIGSGGTMDYDIYLRWQVPSNFSAFKDDTDGIKMSAWRTTSTEKVELSVYQANGTQCGSTTEVNSSNTTWQTTGLTGNETSCSVSANDVLTFRIRMTASSSGYARAGQIQINYLSQF